MEIREPGRAERILRSSALTPSLYIAVLLCFLLSFCNFRCGTMSLANIKGIDMALGNRVDMAPRVAAGLREFERTMKQDSDADADKPSRFSKKDFTQKLPVNFWLLGAVLLCVLGILFSLIYMPRKQLLLMIMGAAVLGALAGFILTRGQYMNAMLKFKDMPPEMAGVFMNIELVQLEPLAGYWITIGMAVLTTAVCFRQYKIYQRELEDELAIEFLATETDEADGKPESSS